MHIPQSKLGIIGLLTSAATIVATILGATAHAEMAETYCTIRDPNRLDCLWVVKDERRRMTSQDVSNFIDQAQVSAYMTVRSRAGLERVFLIDPEAPSFKKLRSTERSSSVSEIIKVKSDLFTEIENRVVKLSDEMDSQATGAELVKYDPSIAVDHAKLQERALVQEVSSYRDKKNQEIPTSGGANSGLIRSKHRLFLAYEDEAYAGNFSQNSQSAYNSVDNHAALLQYRLTLDRWIFEAETEYYTAYSNYNKGSFGGTTTYTGTDSSKSVNNFSLRGNYCWTAWSTTQICPGAEVIYDQFPVMSFSTLNYTNGAPDGTSILQMQSATDLTLAASVLVNFPIYRSLSLYNRLAYLSGTGVLGGPNKLKANTAYDVNVVAEWPMWKGLAANVGVEYISRSVTFQVNGTGTNSASTNVDNNMMSNLTTRVGVTWLFDEL